MEITHKQYFIEAIIVNHKMSKEKYFPYSKYVEYELMLNTKYKIWTIYRRYSKFENLHLKLSKEFKKLPTLPKKAFFNFGEGFIEERKIGLQNYLNQLFHIINFYNCGDLLEFIEIDREALLLMTKSNTFVDQRDKNLSFIKITQNNFNTFSESCESTKMLEEKEKPSETKETVLNEYDAVNIFLENLELKEGDKIRNIEKFISFLKSKKSWPKFRKEDIIKLLFGDFKTQKGLVYHCGTIKENRLGAEACIDLLGKLISFEFNPECELYVQILKKMPLVQLKKLNLINHIKNSSNKQKEICLKILSIVKDERESIFSQLMIDDEVQEIYESWVQNCL